MTKKQHINHHKRLHAALLVLVEDWQACAINEIKRMPEKRSVLSLVEWSKRQIENPDEVVIQKEVSDKLLRERQNRFIFHRNKNVI